MSKIIDDQIESNRKRGNDTFFGGRENGFDYICFDGDGRIRASGTRKDMIAYAIKFNWAVGILIPVRFQGE